ncbi:MAG: YebC/PmpR family DNA-binding transcriptional regulator, partial [Cetobacterium sp.]
FSRRNGNLGTDGAVAWMFARKGEIVITGEGIDADELMMAALEAGAEDVRDEDGEFIVITDSIDCNTVAEELKKAGYNVTESEVAMIPDNKVQITDLDTAKKVMALYEALDDLDDVNDVYSNFDISDELLEQL